AAGLLYKYRGSVKLGQIERFNSSLNLEDFDQSSFWVRIKNLELLPLKAFYLLGPYILYCDIRNPGFGHNDLLNYITADQPRFEPNLHPNQTMIHELSCHTIKKKYVWVIDIVSQIIFSDSASVSFEILLSKSKEKLHSFLKVDHQNHFIKNGLLTIVKQDTFDLWNLPLPIKEKPLHLVLLTHGLHSNVSADMYYIKEQIDKTSSKTGENLIVRGYPGNICKTERGIKYLGSRMAEYIIKDILPNHLNIDKISFIGHSLGGLVQTFSIAYIENNYPWFFKKIKPVNFITLASPLLGILNIDQPSYINIALSSGMVGKTGMDLGLKLTELNSTTPLLYLLPTGPAHRILKKFKNRTIYANAINDGIVPLRTSGLFFLDYDKITIPSFKPLQSAVSSWIFPQNPVILDDKSNIPILENSSINSGIELPKASMIESAASILFLPLPSKKYLMDPKSRENCIIHDEYYTEEIVNELLKKLNEKKKILKENQKKTKKLEKTIALKWHKGMTWRKVLVKLKPDAHNNIIVRRRFSNAYGWLVVDHLVNNHFQNDY
ncbi:putative lipase ROG1, partial [Ascoidea rubescens DSM 1968]